MLKTILIFNLFVLASISLKAQFFNEIHYDNTGADVNEKIEIAGVEGVSLSGWKIILYNGSNGLLYNTTNLSGTFPNHCTVNGTNYGTIVFSISGIQNGAPDGMALIKPDGSVKEFLSYEGVFDALDGPANGLTSIDIGASENGMGATIGSIGRNSTDPWTTDANNNTFGACNSNQLPIELLNFETKISDGMVVAKWSTATEIENDYFSIQRSPNGRDFSEIGQVKGAGTSYEPQDYTFTDERPLQGKNYYRLKQVDFDGKYSYSPVVTATFGKASLMILAPMPATEMLNIQLEKPTKDDGIWQVYDMNGRLLLSGEMLAETTEQPIHIAELPDGAYVLRLTVGQEVMVEQFRKQD